MRGESDLDRIGQRIAALAADQFGVVAARQLVSLGLSPDAIERRARRGLLHRVHRGVYAVGHPRLDARGRWMAAVLACGPRAFLSHGDAAAAWDLLPVGAGLIHLTIAGRAGRTGHRGLQLHRVGVLAPVHRGTVGKLPVTSPERTLADLAAVLSQRRLAQALERADARRIVDHAHLADLAASRRPGVRRLRAVLAGPLTRTRSDLEIAFLELCDRNGLPEPVVNQIVAGYEVDFFWPALGLAIETDGGERHLTRRAFEGDRRRDADLAVAGLRVVRFTHDQVTNDPGRTAAVLLALHARLGAARRA